MMVAAERLPADPIQRHATLRDYFCDKDASAVLTPEGWSLALSWPGDPDRHVDPGLDTGLQWWGDVRREDMATARRRTSRLLRTLYDSWTLASWSEWLSRRPDRAAGFVTILHIDDHRDLGSPRLVGKGMPWLDLISGRTCDLHEPSSVAAAIESGAIGMGSFMTPFLLHAPQAEVRHLCQPPKAKRTEDYLFRPTDVHDRLLAPGTLRPGIELVLSEPGTGAGRWRTTPSVDDWLSDISGGPILLHVDMDYFCNRYDGDSDWSDRDPRLDPPPEVIDRKIDEIVGALSAKGLVGRIEDVVIAFSPGFFPAEHWGRADERLTLGLGLDAERTG